MNEDGWIDFEPTWEEVLGMAQRLAESSKASDAIEALRPACKIADVVRQAQKSGAKAVHFTFEDKKVSFEVEA